MGPIEINEDTRLLVYKNGYTASFVQRTLADEGLEGLQVRAVFPDEKWSDLAFLRDFSFLTQLQLTAVPASDFDYTFLSELNALEHLIFAVHLVPGVKAKPLDLGQVPRLNSLSLSWRDNILGFEQLTRLESLRVSEYRCEDLRAVSALSQLRRLVVMGATIRSVSGIETLRALETLALGGCRRLHDLEGLAALEQLRDLRLAGCPKVTHLRGLASQSNLRRLTLEDCSNLENVEPLAGLGLAHLDLCGTTNIRNGDTTPLRTVAELSYCHRKHYNVRIPTPIADALVAENRRKILGVS